MQNSMVSIAASVRKQLITKLWKNQETQMTFNTKNQLNKSHNTDMHVVEIIQLFNFPAFTISEYLRNWYHSKYNCIWHKWISFIPWLCQTKGKTELWLRAVLRASAVVTRTQCSMLEQHTAHFPTAYQTDELSEAVGSNAPVQSSTKSL